MLGLFTNVKNLHIITPSTLCLSPRYRGELYMKKVALFFGAGAEQDYGLPSGGEFALDIFRMDVAEDKEIFKKTLEKIDLNSDYAKWFPDKFLEKNRSAFIRSQYEELVKGSLESKRDIIIKYMDNFDENVSRIAKEIEKGNIYIDQMFEKILSCSLENLIYEKHVKLNTLLDGKHNALFASKYFSAFLIAMETKNTNIAFKNSMKDMVRTLLELLIGSLGENLIHKLNDGIFERSPDTLDVFDDLGSIFSLNYEATGMRGLEWIIEKSEKNIFKLKSDEEIIVEFSRMILEDLFCRALDYKSLLDSNWSYLYNPKTDWTKFTKVVIFLHTVRRYILNIAKRNYNNIKNGDGYYHDLIKIKRDYEIVAIGTANYNTFIEDITNEEVCFLNGSVRDFYDPYLNTIIDEEKAKISNHLTVPFLFTQNGIKPLTSVRMAERYVDIYNRFKMADIVCICGFGFNDYDSHINGMFRALIEDERKNIIIISHAPSGNTDINKLMETYKKKLRIENTDHIKILQVNKERKINNEGTMWYESLE